MSRGKQNGKRKREDGADCLEFISRVTLWSKNGDDEQARQSGGQWPTPILYSTLMGRKRGGKEQTASLSR